ncbi:hypothetical protein QF004_001046 [Chryseobacterium sp. MDT2-18]|nr:hypothetical protein [Chryseobacterium sp. MDT2-18]
MISFLQRFKKLQRSLISVVKYEVKILRSVGTPSKKDRNNVISYLN